MFRDVRVVVSDNLGVFIRIRGGGRVPLIAEREMTMQLMW